MSTALVPRPSAPVADGPTPQADSDAHLIRLWLARSASPNTRRTYARQAARFRAQVGKPLGSVRVGDLQDYLAGLPGSSATVALAASVLKSLLTFAHELGYLPFNVGAVLKAPPVKTTLAERILDEAAVHRMLALEPAPRNRALLTLLYGGGLRISEIAGLRGRDLAPRDEAGQVTVYGKGGKTRVVLLSTGTWRLLADLRGAAGPDDPVFRSRKGGGPLDASAVHRVVKAAAVRAGLSAEVSAHWLRHAHASHALDRGAPVHLVQATLGHASVATTGRYLHARPSDSSARYLSV
ncbi:tyrosine-type recombinase/integrase [Methylobacterium sp. WSM2598]|uniref:tyrosine-type recombinase/integrase n=1 Tax=Methylobacterium sp. WSM2598 TaxID=398261 RepID=UPI00035CC3B7|nr:tyrosine-type recombinase/integrase [Methylobacterium sp. WSM2598]